ncbi:MAG: FUSC family protein [Candidatus Microthrix subdominans]|jgi:hypothetical protein
MTRGGGITWNWRFAGYGAVLGLVAVILVFSGQVLTGTYLMIGSIAAAVVGLAPQRGARRPIIIVGVFFGVSILLGSILAVWVPLAVVGMFVVGYLAAQVAARKPAGVVALSVILPLTAVGLTYDGIGNSAKVAGLMILGAIGSYVWAMVLPEYEGEVPQQPQMTPAEANHYGLVLGVAGAVSTLVAFTLDVSYVGWLVGSTLLVIRPTWDLLSARGLGRMVSVLVGGTAAALLLLADLPTPAIAVVLWLVLVAMAATSGSRWYVTPAFTSFLILWALLYGQAERNDVKVKLDERVVDTVIGVAVAYLVSGAFSLWGRAAANRRHDVS